MKLKPPKIRLIAKSTTGVDDAMQELINGVCVACNCSTCYYSQWNEENTDVYCTKFLSPPPLWAVAIGCAEYDYIPF